MNNTQTLILALAVVACCFFVTQCAREVGTDPMQPLFTPPKFQPQKPTAF